MKLFWFLKLPKIFVLFEDGRLGNQFFQFQYAVHIARGSTIILFGFGSLRKFLQHHSTFRLSNVFFIPDIPYISKLFIRLACLPGLFSRINEDSKCTEKFVMSYSAGILSFINILQGFFQFELKDSVFLDNIFLPDFVSTKVFSQMSGLSGVYDPTSWFFVHVRRGDYLIWPNPQKPAFLPSSWYRKSMQNILTINPSAHFFLFSDDQAYLVNEFSNCSGCSILHSSELTDFYYMSHCLGGGILSPSSYSWWVSFFIFRASKIKPFFLGPLHWAGWRNSQWVPYPSIEASFITYQSPH